LAKKGNIQTAIVAMTEQIKTIACVAGSLGIWILVLHNASLRTPEVTISGPVDVSGELGR
jgi:hypothetical protein